MLLLHGLSGLWGRSASAADVAHGSCGQDPTPHISHADALGHCGLGTSVAEVPHPPPYQESSLVRELSISFFKDVMETVVGRNKKTMRKTVKRVLLPLFLHMNDQTKSVAKVQ